MNEPRPRKRYSLWAVVLSGVLLAGALVASWANSRGGEPAAQGGFIDPDDYVGSIPPGVKLDTYPRLVPWELLSVTDENATTVLELQALAYACNLSKHGPEQMTETFDRVEVSETAATVTIETWLGPPEGDGLWPSCKGTGFAFDVRVELDGHLGTRELVDPACELERYANFIVCETAKQAKH